VEAFAPADPVSTAEQATLSAEGQEGISSESWIRVRAPNHWPTLYWKSAEARGVPLISQNTALLLGSLVGGSVEPGAGIVFGKVPRGWLVEFSGRAERVIYLDSQRRPVAPNIANADRYFAFINAAPGGQLLYLTALDGSTHAALALPVLEGNATYADLTRFSSTEFDGRVLDGSSADAAPIAGATVRVVGQPDQTATTDARGRFDLRNVVSFGSQPLYLETLDHQGFTHRYRVSAQSAHGLSLFRFGPQSVSRWVGQLEGGINSESGLVVAAVPQVVSKNMGDALIPVVHPLLDATTLTPETYGLAPDDQLTVDVPLDEASPRFVSVQVPEGPNVARLEDQSRKTVWSALIYASPGVINVVGPY